jgi:hypothetical protein
MGNAEWGMRNAEGGVRNGEWGLRIGDVVGPATNELVAWYQKHVRNVFDDGVNPF